MPSPLSNMLSKSRIIRQTVAVEECTQSVDGTHGLIVEAWGQGILIGSMIILICLTIASMRRRILLHKLILAELICASLHGSFIFVSGPAYSWYLATTATLLYISYNLHNLINWLKIKPFLSRWASRIYIGTVILVIPYWIAESVLNFMYNNDVVTPYFRQTRPWEALCREPWWLFTTAYLIWTIRRSYDCTFTELFKASGRFGILMLSMTLSIAFVVVDVVNVATGPLSCAGRNPYWKLTLVFKCVADVIFLDDFKSVLNKLTIRAKGNFGPDADATLGGDDDPAVEFKGHVKHRGISFFSHRSRASAATVADRSNAAGSTAMSEIQTYPTHQSRDTDNDTHGQSQGSIWGSNVASLGEVVETTNSNTFNKPTRNYTDTSTSTSTNKPKLKSNSEHIESVRVASASSSAGGSMSISKTKSDSKNQKRQTKEWFDMIDIE